MQQFPNWGFVFYHPAVFAVNSKFYFVQSQGSM